MGFIPDIITGIKGPYQYDACWSFLESRGQAAFGPQFRLCPQDAETILKLMAWALKDETQAARHHVHLHKGIMLTGPVGCGKTSLMKLLRLILPTKDRYPIKSCREIAFEFATDGYPVIGKYGRQSFSTYAYTGAEAVPMAICFDDLGLEPIVQYYGNSANVMAELLLSRYDFFGSHGMLTHITTNLNSQEIEEKYGTRVRSRCRELFNLVSFDKSAPDKRS